MDFDQDHGEKLKRLDYLRRHLLETIPNSYGRVKADLERVLKTVEQEIQNLRERANTDRPHKTSAEDTNASE